MLQCVNGTLESGSFKVAWVLAWFERSHREECRDRGQHHDQQLFTAFLLDAETR